MKFTKVSVGDHFVSSSNDFYFRIIKVDGDEVHYIFMNNTHPTKMRDSELLKSINKRSNNWELKVPEVKNYEIF